jgi:hypothetical protein
MKFHKRRARAIFYEIFLAQMYYSTFSASAPPFMKIFWHGVPFMKFH